MAMKLFYYEARNAISRCDKWKLLENVYVSLYVCDILCVHNIVWLGVSITMRNTFCVSITKAWSSDCGVTVCDTIRSLQYLIISDMAYSLKLILSVEMWPIPLREMLTDAWCIFYILRPEALKSALSFSEKLVLYSARERRKETCRGNTFPWQRNIHKWLWPLWWRLWWLLTAILKRNACDPSEMQMKREEEREKRRLPCLQLFEAVWRPLRSLSEKYDILYRNVLQRRPSMHLKKAMSCAIISERKYWLWNQ